MCVMKTHLTGKVSLLKFANNGKGSFFKETFPDTRQVLLRIGFALGKDGGALEPLKKLAKFNLGGTVG